MLYDQLHLFAHISNSSTFFFLVLASIRVSKYGPHSGKGEKYRDVPVLMSPILMLEKVNGETKFEIDSELF